MEKEKKEESKEILASSDDQDIRNAELRAEVEKLKELINEYKMIHIEDMKYKEIVQGLIEKGIINSEGEELMKF